MSSESFMIKLCDRLENVSDFEIADPKFVEKYSKSTKEIFARLTRNLSMIERAIINDILKACE
jgi:(p)ppGpp synthase/HD superfamily hydrolase